MKGALLLCLCAAIPAVDATAAPTAPDWQARLAEANKYSPHSPAGLSLRLQYVEFLLDQDLRPCAQRLDLAQSQVDLVTADPAVQVAFPQGWARPVDLQYRIHQGRAACAIDAGARRQALEAAVPAAQRAAELYRDGMDYRSMAVMQYNIAVSLQALGNNAAALAALVIAVQMDQEFGMRADAQDNYGLLLKWRNEPADADQVALRMADFPDRSTTLNFAWSAGDAAAVLNMSHASLVKGKLLHASDSLSCTRQTRAIEGGWRVSCVPTAGAATSGVWPRETDEQEGALATFRPALLQFPPIEVTDAGDFKSADDLVGFAARVTQAAESAIKSQAPAGKRTGTRVETAVNAADVAFAPEVIANAVTESYGLETAMWIGATLKQGESYELVVPLSLPGMQHVIVDHSVQFVFTRELPCTSGPASRACVELVIRATPLERPLQDQLSRLPLPSGVALHYVSSLSMRLIVDPQTLNVYLRDTRRYWYVTLGHSVPSDVVMESDRSELRLSYTE